VLVTGRGESMSEPVARRRFGPFKTLLFSTLIVVAFFVMAEASLRVWVYLFRSPAERFDVTTGTFVLVTGVHTRVGAPPIRINSKGFAGPEFQDPRLPGTIRIAAIGDSCTFGEGNLEGTYPAQLQRRLDALASPTRVEVINAGIEGLNSELALRRLESKVLPLRPDVVTVYVGWNDLMKVNPTSQTEHPGFAIVARSIDRLWLIKGLRKALFYYLRPQLANPATGRASRTGVFRDYRPAVFEGNLRTIIRTSRDFGARVVVMTLPSVVSDDMTVEDLYRANVVFPYFATAYAVGDYVDLIAAYNASIRRIAADEGVTLVDLAAEIDGRPDRRRLFLDTMHPNQPGRELIADILSQRMRENGVLRVDRTTRDLPGGTGRPASP
jgi:lysophospholipase L1-like esterase